MPKPVEYLDKLWREESLLANWPPDKLLVPGQIVTRDRNGTISVETTIGDVVARADERLPAINLVSREASPIQSQVGATFAAASGASGGGTALNVTFAKAGGFTLKAEGGLLREFETIAPWRALVTRLLAKARWQRGWQLVTHVRDYERITLVRASKAGQRASLKTTVPAELTGGLTDVAAGASAASASTGCSIWAVTAGSTLGYEALGVNWRWIRSSTVESADLYHAYGVHKGLERTAVVEMMGPDLSAGDSE